MPRDNSLVDPTNVNPTTSKPDPMTPGQRLTTPMKGAVGGWEQFTPDQQWFRDNAEGRMQADFDSGAHAPANKIEQKDGCVDTTRMEPNGDSYIDLGGKGGVDVAAGKP